MRGETEQLFPDQQTERITMFCDLRNSTEILMNFEEGRFDGLASPSEEDVSYGGFIRDVHETSYQELYLGDEHTYAEIYGDGVMGIFPHDNTRYLVGNLYRLTKRMRRYNDALTPERVGLTIDIGFGITVGLVAFTRYPFDDRVHPVGQCIHAAARIEALSKVYGARVLISETFFNFAKGIIATDPRFSHRFVDRIVLKGFRKPTNLFEILIDNDPRFPLKRDSRELYGQAVAKFQSRDWAGAGRLFDQVTKEFGLEMGAIMSSRCAIFAAHPPEPGWDRAWRMSYR